MSRVLNRLNTTTIPGIIDDPEKYLGPNYQEVIDFWNVCEAHSHEEITDAIENRSAIKGINQKYRNLVGNLNPGYYPMGHCIHYYHCVYRPEYVGVVAWGTKERIIKQQLLDKGFQMVYTNPLDLNAMKRAAIHNLIVFQEQILKKENSKMEKLKQQLESVPPEQLTQ
jgi:hypothetical protein